MKKALVAMSGGVDSAVTALLLKEMDYECIGVYFKMFDKSNPIFGFDKCSINNDIDDAKAVCQRLGMKFFSFDAWEQFSHYVIKDFVETYEKGGTPNPCVVCNRNVKFKLLNDKMIELGCEVMATGHYAKICHDEESGRYIIKKADYINKDQSYMLYQLTQEQLSHVIFPLGTMDKETARKIAEENNLVNAKKSDSQDICFIPNGEYSDFIKRFTNKSYPAGDFVDINGKTVGKHEGIVNYTIGQRRGLAVAMGERVYVKQKDVKNNKIILSNDKDLYEKEFYIEDFNPVAIDKITDGLRCSVKIRYSQKQYDAAVSLEGEKIKIVFDEPQRAPTKGQSAVLYDGDIVLGGGIIE